VRRRNAQTRRDSRFALAREFAPVPFDRRERRGEVQLHAELALAGDRPHRPEQRLVVDVRRHEGLRAVRVDVAQREGLHGAVRFDRGLQQRRVEGPHLRAVGGRAFGTHADDLALAHLRRDVVVHAPRVGAAAAFDEKRADAVAQRPDQRPAADLGLRDEHARHHRVHREDVEPRHVIEHDHAALRPRVGHVEPVDVHV